MKLKLALDRPGWDAPQDIVVTADPCLTAGHLAEVLARRDPRRPGVPRPGLTLCTGQDADRRVVPPHTPLADAGIRSGQTIALVDEQDRPPDGVHPSPVATLRVLEGPDAGRRVALVPGISQVGRGSDNQVCLTDPAVSKRHARLKVTDVVEIIDLGSTNGVVIDGARVQRTILRGDDEVLLGDSVVAVAHDGRGASSLDGTTEAFNRSPHLDPVWPGEELVAPEPPVPPSSRQFPLVALAIGVVMVGVMFLVRRNPAMMIFVAFSPLLLLGGFWDHRQSARRQFKASGDQFRAALADLEGQLRGLATTEAEHRRREHPGTRVAYDAAQDRTPLLWCRRPDRRGFLELQLGTGRRPSRTSVRMPSSNRTVPELWHELLAVVAAFKEVDGIPVVASLAEAGTIGVSGCRADALAVARGLIAQVVVLHSPAEVVVAAVASSGSVADWEWLKWLPHTGPELSPLAVHHLAASPAASALLVAAVEGLVEERSAPHPPRPVTDRFVPAVVMLVEDDAEAERSRLVDLAERGVAVGVHLVWIAPSAERLPAACRVFVDLDRKVVAGFVAGGDRLPIRPDQLDARAAEALGRILAPLVDAGARSAFQSGLPAAVSYLDHVGHDVAESSDAVAGRWRQSQSLAGPAGVDRPPGGRRNDLAAYVGHGAAGPVVLDLRRHGPHALVGGTTGAGKSELLQTWVTSMAVDHSPARVTFLFVDYKGGAAFRECLALPHCVGLVTDLTPHLVRRALRSLRAELQRREELLHRKQCKDILDLEATGDPETPPSLVIVVDEFAALTAEVPDFVEGILNIAQRGRSLGLHLILATQRPAGVIRGNLRANTNLRVALRMADDADSNDVVGTPVAAGFPPDVPGRCVAKLGPGRVHAFQAAFVGGWTDADALPSAVDVAQLRFGAPVPWPPSDPSPAAGPPRAPGPNDLQRIVASVRAAATQAGVASPRRPWLPQLAETYDLAATASGGPGGLVFAVGDLPDSQEQASVAFHPDREGNMAVFGAGGSGKSTFLRTLAAAAMSADAGPCHVYGLDFATRGLAGLETLPHVGSVLTADDHERITRLLGRVRGMIDDRAPRYAAIQAGTIAEYRARSGRTDEPRVLLLVDGFPAFRSAYEVGPRQRWYEMFQSIATDGRPVGVHVVLTADRHAAVPSSLASLIQRRLVLRLANDLDYTLLHVPPEALGATAPPGRGFVDGIEVQVLVPGGTASMAGQAEALERRIAKLAAGEVRPPAPAVERLTERVRLGELPPAVEGLPTLGVADDTFAPCGFHPGGVLVVCGPPHSGRTSVTASMALAVRRVRPDSTLVHLGKPRSPLRGILSWTESATDVGAVAALASRLAMCTGTTPADALPVVVVEDPATFATTAADGPLQSLIKAYRAAGGLLIAEGETSTMTSALPLLQLLKAGRHGVALMPDPPDGDAVFRTPFPRSLRAEYPPGRGLYVRHGRTVRIQCALPDLDPS